MNSRPGTALALVRYHSPEKHELVLCSHVMYHVPLSDRFFVLESCYTAEELAALSEDAERCRGADGVYRMEQDEDLLLIPKS
ncbi:hypothetical protein [Hyalangium sp.]|uniref:hypothetical protein n=1 Tax=Hyalangium sp. TaxID=2028555 RepID=UPI002D30E28E|nr:hypothetical protein [Hyalangium sp.]HYI01243.1 hypothetical protein [Hyalangium sp.]